MFFNNRLGCFLYLVTIILIKIKHFLSTPFCKRVEQCCYLIPCYQKSHTVALINNSQNYQNCLYLSLFKLKFSRLLFLFTKVGNIY